MNAHYVYKITNINPVDERQFYIGVHTCKNIKPEDDTEYMGSSEYLDAAIREQGLEFFSKEILSTWETRDLAEKEEKRLHREINVAAHLEYYNMVNSNGCVPSTIGHVVVIDKNTNEKKLVSKEDFETHENYVGVSTGLVMAIDTRDGSITRITRGEYESSSFYISPAKGRVQAIDTRDNVVKNISIEEFKNNHFFKGVCSGKVTVLDTRDKTTKSVSVEDFNTFEYYVSPLCGKVPVIDIRDNSRKSISLTEFYSCDFYKHPRSELVTVVDTRDGLTKSVTKEDFDNHDYYVGPNSKKIGIFNKEDNLVFVSVGNFNEFCDNYKLPMRALRKSYNSGGKRIYENLSFWNAQQVIQKQFDKYIGWYARIID